MKKRIKTMRWVRRLVKYIDPALGGVRLRKEQESLRI